MMRFRSSAISFRALAWLAGCLWLVSCGLPQRVQRPAKTLGREAAARQAQLGICVYDPQTRRYLYRYQDDHLFVPASNTKILTSYLAMKYLGDSLTAFRYQPLPGGDLLLIPGGDPSLLHPDFSSDRILEFLRGYRQIYLVPDLFSGNRYGPGWSWDDYLDDYMAENNALPLYGNLVRFRVSRGRLVSSPAWFARNLPEQKAPAGEGLSAWRPLGSNAFRFQAGQADSVLLPFNTGPFSDPRDLSLQATLLADTLGRPVAQLHLDRYGAGDLPAFHSQPTDSLLKITLHRSDNFFAEQSLYMVSFARLGCLDQERIIDTLLGTDLRDLPQPPRWVDGSGLSRYNLFSPQDFVSILDRIRREFGMTRVHTLFSAYGPWSPPGNSSPQPPIVYAKTGSMSGVYAFSGYLYTHRGRLLLFSFLLNNFQGPATGWAARIHALLQKWHDQL
ncbi:MAG TPA: D-alanyl-D-alanine carboxypeptidase [Chitinophagaceae bacterium]|nr:D-alanyl-D-alanine carboxypeptidase [Chitinophagaceae bacterium]